MLRLEVPRHVFVCVDGEYVVLLDLRSDRYWALEADKTRALAHVVRGWPALAPDPECGNRIDSDPGIARMLLQKGLLCEVHDASKDATPIRLAAPRSELANAGVGARHDTQAIWRFLLAAMLAAAAMKYRSFEQVVSHARRRKQARGEQATSLDLSQAAELVGSFERLRPLLFSSRDACLFNSLVLIEFLARHELFPQWVFGVQARPFAAHCWVQHEGVVFNDTLDHVRRYAPIMAI